MEAAPGGCLRRPTHGEAVAHFATEQTMNCRRCAVRRARELIAAARTSPRHHSAAIGSIPERDVIRMAPRAAHRACGPMGQVRDREVVTPDGRAIPNRTTSSRLAPVDCGESHFPA